MAEKSKVSEAQKRASRKWEEKNREKTRIDSYRRTARLFINKYAEKDDLEILKKLIKEKEKKL